MWQTTGHRATRSAATGLHLRLDEAGAGEYRVARGPRIRATEEREMCPHEPLRRLRRQQASPAGSDLEGSIPDGAHREPVVVLGRGDREYERELVRNLERGDGIEVVHDLVELADQGTVVGEAQQGFEVVLPVGEHGDAGRAVRIQCLECRGENLIVLGLRKEESAYSRAELRRVQGIAER